MDSDRDRGAVSSLQAGITEAELITAIELSGYPLQLKVGTVLRELLKSPRSSIPGFVQDEWGYLDRETGQQRTLDLHASMWLLDPKLERYAQPQLALLVECKRSDYPFVFFPATNVWLPNFPAVVGVPHESIEVRLPGLPQGALTGIPMCLGLDQHSMAPAPAHAITLSIARREGKTLQLTGSTSYNETVLPLLKGLDYLRRISGPGPTQYFECTAALLICVVDAPMVMARPENATTILGYPPWVRLIRDEPQQPDGSQMWRPYVIDYVHLTFLVDYIRQHLLPFAETFSQRVEKHWRVLSRGVAIADDLSNPRLEATLREAPTT
jgi:hypothetical protein